ncbi:MAG: CbiX/SirB N-terminal domain-containing protein [Mariprofundus sp.]|nr:CbiX/SirB N-terminal domain-containing protein [Mariprofundus sp.]
MNILLAHGSSNASHTEQVEVLAAKVSELLGEEVRVAYLNDQLLPEGARVLPLFLGEGKHVREDIPSLIAASVDCELLPALTEQSDVIAQMAIDLITRDTRRINALFVLYRFSGFEKLATAMYEKMNVCSKHALASLHSEPSVPSLLQHWQAEALKQMSVQPLLLFKGASLVRLQSMMNDVDLEISQGPVLSEHEAFPQLIADCFKAKASEEKS